MNTKMSIKSIVLFEKMTDIAFSDMSFSGDYIINNTEVFLKLLYCILISHPENNIKCTYEEAKTKLFTDEKLFSFSNELFAEISLLNQFVNYEKLKSSIDSSIYDKPKTEEKPSIYMKSLVPVLIMDCGLDPEYVYNKMDYTDIDDFMRYREDKHRNDLEEKRLFTFLTVVPHINSKKVRTPDKFYPFPWEKEKNKKKAMKDYERARKKLLEYGIIEEKS